MTTLSMTRTTVTFLGLLTWYVLIQIQSTFAVADNLLYLLTCAVCHPVRNYDN